MRVLKNRPPSAYCKELWQVTQHPDTDQLAAVAKKAFGPQGKATVIAEWFARRRRSQFSNQEARVKRQCTQVVKQSVLGAVERFLRQSRAVASINGQCTVKNLQHILRTVGLSVCGPKPELVQRLYNNLHVACSMLGLAHDSAPATEPESVNCAPEVEEEEEVTCVACGSGDIADDNQIILCDGEHETEIGYHQQCVTPPLQSIPAGSWFCPQCAAEHVCGADTSSEYVPSSDTATSSNADLLCAERSDTADSSNSSSDDSSDTSSDDSSDSSSDSSSTSSSNTSSDDSSD